MAFVPLIYMAIASAAVTAASEIQQGKTAKAQGNMQNKIAKYNADLAERQGKARLDAAKMNSDRMSRQQRLGAATNAALGAKSGISISESKSSIEVLADNAFQYHMDKNLILNQGMQDYVSGQNQASLLRVEGKWAKKMGNEAMRNSYLSAGAKGIGSFASMYSMGSSSGASNTASTSGTALNGGSGTDFSWSGMAKR